MARRPIMSPTFVNSLGTCPIPIIITRTIGELNVDKPRKAKSMYFITSTTSNQMLSYIKGFHRLQTLKEPNYVELSDNATHSFCHIGILSLTTIIRSSCMFPSTEQGIQVQCNYHECFFEEIKFKSQLVKEKGIYSLLMITR